MTNQLTQLWDEAVERTDLSPEMLARLGTLSCEERDYAGPQRLPRASQSYRAGPGESKATQVSSIAATAAKTMTLEAAIGLNIIFSRLAFLSPSVTAEVMDAMATSWLGAKEGKAQLTLLSDETQTSLTERRALPPELSKRIWAMLERREEFAGSPEGYTAEIASFGTDYDESVFGELEESLMSDTIIASLVEKADREGMPKPIDVETLAACPPRSFGQIFRHLIVGNGFDVEVLPMDEPAPGEISYPGLHFTTRRVLQTHDVFHLIADYPITPFGEIGISGFQLAQLGQNYSAAFFAVTSRVSLFFIPEVLDAFFQLTFEGWRHGRTSPNLLGVDWHQYWDQPIPAVRDVLGINPFVSTIQDTAEDKRYPPGATIGPETIRTNNNP